MRSLVILLSLVCAVLASLEEDGEKWKEFKIKYGKTYRNPQEEKFRFSIFRQTLQEIEEHNAQYEAGNTTFKKAVNHFADMTTEEFISILTHQRSNFSELGIITSYENPVSVDVPASIDWRQKGAVSPVKNQGSCGCCWAFSVTGVLESFYYLKHKKMLLLSEQQLLDCAGYSCNGGDEGPALKYVQDNGIETEQRYPYKGRQLSCRHDRSASAMHIKGYVQLKRGDEKALLSAVGTLGPVSVALDANEIKQYHSGVFSSQKCSKVKTNHAVLAVGYGRDARTGVDYWIIKNSWGPNWGEKGFFRLRRGTNECAISLDNVYPVLS